MTACGLQPSEDIAVRDPNAQETTVPRLLGEQVKSTLSARSWSVPVRDGKRLRAVGRRFNLDYEVFRGLDPEVRGDVDVVAPSSLPSTTTSPRLTPMRSSSRLSGAASAFHAASLG